MLFFLFFYSTYALNNSISSSATFSRQPAYSYSSTMRTTPTFAPTSTVVPNATFITTSSFEPTASFVPTASLGQLVPSLTSLSYSFFSNTQSASLSSSNYVSSYLTYTPSISNPIIPKGTISENYNMFILIFGSIGCGLIFIFTCTITFFCLKQNHVKQMTKNVSIQMVDNPAVSNPVVSNPVVSNPAVSNPVVSNPVVSNPVVSNPVVNNHMVNNPVVSNPVVNNPVVSNPVVSNPVVNNHMVNNPVVSNPVVNNPVVSNPMVSNPVVYLRPKSVISDGKIFYYDGNTDKLLAEGWQRYSDEVDVWYCNSNTNESSWIPVYLVSESS